MASNGGESGVSVEMDLLEHFEVHGDNALGIPQDESIDALVADLVGPLDPAELAADTKLIPLLLAPEPPQDWRPDEIDMATVEMAFQLLAGPSLGVLEKMEKRKEAKRRAKEKAEKARLAREAAEKKRTRRASLGTTKPKRPKIDITVRFLRNVFPDHPRLPSLSIDSAKIWCLENSHPAHIYNSGLHMLRNCEKPTKVV